MRKIEKKVFTKKVNQVALSGNDDKNYSQVIQSEDMYMEQAKT